eukprot:6456438-Amphidinium_carterae.2
MLRLERVMVTFVDEDNGELPEEEVPEHHPEQAFSPRVECMLSLDAAKCFDAIRQSDIVWALHKLGVPTHVTTMLGVYYQCSCRFFSMAGHLDTSGFYAERGIPQGDPWSVLGTNALEVEWIEQVQGSLSMQMTDDSGTEARREAPIDDHASHASRSDTVEGHALMDDRTLMSTSLEHISAGFARHQAWDAQHGWTLNPSKSALLVAPHDVVCEGCVNDDIVIRRVHACKLLGHELKTKYNVGSKVQYARLVKALRVAQRVRVCSVHFNTAARVIRTAVLAAYRYGMEMTSTPKAYHAKLRVAIKAALSY